jgi:hypothetical protein
MRIPKHSRLLLICSRRPLLADALAVCGSAVLLLHLSWLQLLHLSSPTPATAPLPASCIGARKPPSPLAPISRHPRRRHACPCHDDLVRHGAPLLLPVPLARPSSVEAPGRCLSPAVGTRRLSQRHLNIDSQNLERRLVYSQG